jgi:small subunit ribosomal protein S17
MGKRKEFTGIVISDKMQKTVIIRTMRMSKHPKYNKILKKYNKFKAHDESKVSKVGDTVLIEETRPLSKDKRFRVVSVIKKAQTPRIEIKEEIK